MILDSHAVDWHSAPAQVGDLALDVGPQPIYVEVVALAAQLVDELGIVEQGEHRVVDAEVGVEAHLAGHRATVPAAQVPDGVHQQRRGAEHHLAGLAGVRRRRNVCSVHAAEATVPVAPHLHDRRKCLLFGQYS